MEWWQQVALLVANLLVTGVLIPMARSISRMRANDLHGLQKSVDRIEQKLDDHITYHLEKRL